MKVIKTDLTPSEDEIEIAGKPLERPLTVLEFKEAYDKWIPKDDILFDKLLSIIVSVTPFFPLIDKDTIIIYFQDIFDQIQDGLERKQSLASFLEIVAQYKFNLNIRKVQKKNKYTGYYKNPEQKIKGNMTAAKKVYESLINEGSREGTKTTQLANLLIEYVNQCNDMLNSEERIIKPLEIKDYKLTPEKTKEHIKEHLKNIIKKFDIKVKSYDLKSAIDSL